MSNSVLLNNVDHHDLRVITQHGADFGDAINQVMVFPTEFESVQREYPIVFRKDQDGALRSVALLGLDRDENLYLADESWQARYVPALQRRGPFSIATPQDGDGEPMIRVDLDHPRVSQTEGIPLFLPHGGNSPYLEHLTQVLRAIYVGHHQMTPMIAAFEASGLLRPIKLEARVSDDELYTVSEVFTIDEARLAELDGESLAVLHRDGFLRPAFFAAASLANFGQLVERKARKGRGG